MSTQLQYANINNAQAFLGMSSDPIDFGLAGDNVLVSGQVGKTISVYRIFFVVDGATVVTFKSGPATSLSGAITLSAGGSITLDISNIPWFQTGSNKDFILGSTNMVQVSGMIYYRVN